LALRYEKRKIEKGKMEGRKEDRLLGREVAP
jgi:hypothetical protein